MISIIATGLMLYAALNRDDPAPRVAPVKEVRHHHAVRVTPKLRPRVDALKTAPKPPVEQRVAEPVAPQAVNEPQSRAYHTAKLFLTKYAPLAHIGQGEWKNGNHSYREQRMNLLTRQNCLWQTCQIQSRHGNLYLSVLLDEHGNVAHQSQGVVLAYDSTNTASFIYQTHAAQTSRFGKRIFNYEQTIVDEELLAFLMGDETHPYTVNHYLDQAPSKY